MRCVHGGNSLGHGALWKQVDDGCQITFERGHTLVHCRARKLVAAFVDCQLEGVGDSFLRSSRTGTKARHCIALKSQLILRPLFADDTPANCGRKRMDTMNTSSLKHVVIAGATGEVGKALVRLAAADTALRIYALVRRTGTFSQYPNVVEILFDYEDPNAATKLFTEIHCDALLIALGTTTSKAGVQGLLRVDRDYPLMLIDALEKVNGFSSIAFCSAAGASEPRGHYLKVKSEVELRLFANALSAVIVRPSFLISAREDFRPLEVIALPIFRLVFGALKFLFPSSRLVWKYAPVAVDAVAQTMLREAISSDFGQKIVREGKSLAAESK